MDWESFVIAMAYYRNGLRVMVQITMRIAGKGKAEEGAAIIRQKLFAKCVNPV